MKTKSLIVSSLFLIFGLISFLLFMNIGDARLEEDLFWFAFAISIPLNFLIASWWTIWTFSKKGKRIERIALAPVVVAVFTVILLVFGLILMCFPFTEFKFPIIAYVVIGVFYMLAMLFVKRSARHIAKDEKRDPTIKLLEADVLDCVAKATTPAMQTALKKFAESVRFSDPTGSVSVRDIEDLVFEISADLSGDSNADISQKLAKAEAMLESRNNRCKIMKQCK